MSGEVVTVAVLDTETTGLFNCHHFARIVEVGARIVRWWPDTRVIEMGEAFESLVNPGEEAYRRPEAAVALGINKLTVEMIDSAPSTQVVVLRFGVGWLRIMLRSWWLTTMNLTFIREGLDLLTG